MSIANSIAWDKTELIPAIAQDYKSGEVLMLAYMNKEAYELTLKTNIAHYFSRSKQRIWKKGEESGNIQNIKEILLDCDSDTILLKIEQVGDAACHTGRRSCFFKSVTQNKNTSEPLINIEQKYSIVDRLYHVIQEKKTHDPKTSYVAKLFSKGDTAILKKVIEEAGELALAIKDKNKNEAIYEAADLLFHSLVALAYLDINPDLIKQELSKREGVGGIEEKNSRAN
ncbi:MAG: phosphoribosyl-AMP cyclohydrolase / phosphoribosyl-ATP pyrophosphohydrolase [Campylobacterota bacterium]|nr:phosphoribosyl-AMP cyclohydrolase / phosphoribosyl-ATP pyrophosphohydrolase [Campylobacterota bacterium]